MRRDELRRGWRGSQNADHAEPQGPRAGAWMLREVHGEPVEGLELGGYLALFTFKEDHSDGWEHAQTKWSINFLLALKSHVSSYLHF